MRGREIVIFLTRNDEDLFIKEALNPHHIQMVDCYLLKGQKARPLSNSMPISGIKGTHQYCIMMSNRNPLLHFERSTDGKRFIWGDRSDVIVLVRSKLKNTKFKFGFFSLDERLPPTPQYLKDIWDRVILAWLRKRCFRLPGFGGGYMGPDIIRRFALPYELLSWGNQKYKFRISKNGWITVWYKVESEWIAKPHWKRVLHRHVKSVNVVARALARVATAPATPAAPAQAPVKDGKSTEARDE